MASLYDTLKRNFDDNEGLKKYLYGGLLLAVFGLALWVRYMPADSMAFLQALDPYMIARMSSAIAENGVIPSVDVLRYFPFFTPTHLLNNGNIVIPAYLFQVVRMFGVNFMTWAKFYPALMGALAVIPMYFIGKKMFDRKTGVLSAFFLATSAAIMHRSSAGWFEKEPIANVLMITSMYFFIRAWDDSEWISGIVSGTLLGVSATAWGGTNFLFLLYPITVFGIAGLVPIVSSLPVMLFDGEMNRLDVKGLFRAFAPVAVLGTVLPFILNGSSSTWSLPNKFFLVNMGVLAFLALRYVLDEYEIVSENVVPYLSHIIVSIGAFMLLLSPLYSQTLYNRVSGIIRVALQSGGGVIAGTVAENTPASITQVVSKLGASMGARILPGAGLFAEFFSGWTFSLIGSGILAVFFVHLIGKQYFRVKDADINSFAGGSTIAVTLISLLVYFGLSGGQAAAFVPAILLTVLVTSLVYLYELSMSDEGLEQWVIALFIIWGLLFVLTIFTGQMVLASAFAVLQGVFLMSQEGERFETDFHWSYSLVVLWIFSTVYGSTQRSRLIFLTASPVAMVAGIGVSKMFDYIASSSVWEEISISGNFDALSVFAVAASFLLIAVNVSAVTVMAKSIGGSPNDAWMESMDYMREETPEGSVMLSWWDYGYWFESIGERPAVADGGNMGYYAHGNNKSKINYPLAEFLTSDSPENHTDFLETHSTDYIVLDSTMIGKYSAVSQIAHRSNSDFNSMQTAECVTVRTSQGRTCKTATVDNNTVIHYDMRGLEFLVPFKRTADGFSINGKPLIRNGGMTVTVSNVCTGNGVLGTGEDEASSGGFQEALRESFSMNVPFGGCISLHPYYSPSRIVVVPPAIMDSTLVRLYLMDGNDIDFVEKAFDNGYVKMWKVDTEE